MNHRFFQFLSKNIWWIFILALIGTIISPYLFTQFSSNINFTHTGEIGDTIGGLTAPFINFLSVILLFLTLRAQINSNTRQDEIEQKNKDYNIISTLTDQVRYGFDSISFNTTNNENYKGAIALFKIAKITTTNSNIRDVIDPLQIKAFGSTFITILHTITLFLVKNKNSKLDKAEKEIFYLMVKDLSSTVEMTIEALSDFVKRKGVKNLLPEEEPFKDFEELKKLLEKSFEEYNPV